MIKRYWFLGFVSVAIAVTSLGSYFRVATKSAEVVKHSDIKGAVAIIAMPLQLDVYYDEVGEKSVTRIVLENVGSDVVTILGVKTSCGCTQVREQASWSIEPMMSKELDFEVHIPTYGNRQVVISVQTDSTISPTVRVVLNLHGRKLKPPYISKFPPRVAVSAIGDEVTPSSAFRVTCVESRGATWLKGFSAGSGIEIDAPIIVTEKDVDAETVVRDYETSIRISRPGIVGSDLAFRLHPLTRIEPSRPLPVIDVIVSRVTAIRAIPSAVVFRIPAFERRAAERNIVLVCDSKDSWKILKCDSDAIWLSACVIQDDEGKQARRIKLSAIAPSFDRSGLMMTKFRIHTSHPSNPLVEIAVTVIDGSNGALETATPR